MDKRQEGILVVPAASEGKAHLNKSLVSFGRRVIPHKNQNLDREQERKIIQDRRRKIDKMIAGGLKAAGIELDAELRRDLMNQSSSSKQTTTNGLTTGGNQSFLPHLNPDGTITPVNASPHKNCDTDAEADSEVLRLNGQMTSADPNSPMLLGAPGGSNSFMRLTD